MKQGYIVLLLLTVLSSLLVSQSSKNLWKAELEDDVKRIQPVLNGKYLFLASDEYAWLYENATGKKIWSVEIDEYNEKAPHLLVNDTLYLVANEDTLVCYSMLGRSIRWKRSYATIEQDEFFGMKQFDTIAVLSYKKVDVGISLNDGKELWRTPVVYNTDLTEAGTVNCIVPPGSMKYFVLTENDECILISAADGKKLLSLPMSEPNSDLVKEKRAWYLVDTAQQRAAFLFEKSFVSVNLGTNKLSAQVPVKLNEQFNPLFSTAVGIGALTEDKVVHLNVNEGKTSHIPIAVDDIRNMTLAQTDSGAVLVISTDDKLMGWNTNTGRSLWQTPLKFQPANGFIHRFLAQDSGNVIMTYLDPSADLKLSLMSVNAITGKINYRTLVAHADESLPKRALPLPAVASVPLSADPLFGYANAGFDYSVTVTDGNAVFLIRTSAEMILPGTEKPGGEGFVRLDIRNGEVLSRNYMNIADGLSFDGGLASLAPPMTVGNIIIVPGNKKVVALDATTGALRWMLIEQDLYDSYVFDMHMVDSVLYLRTGAHKQQFQYDVKREKISADDLWEEDDYALLAVDTAKGKVHWKRKFESDPGHSFLAYSLSRFAKGKTQFYAADESYLYAISMDTSKHQRLGWTFEFSDSGVGSLDYKQLYQRSEYWDGEGDVVTAQSGDVHLVTKSAVYNGEKFTTALMKFLQVELDREADRLYIFGDDGIGSVNATTGRVAWVHEWDFNVKSIKHRPVHLKGQLFYAMDGKAVLLNKASGKVTVETDVAAEQGLFIMPDHSSVIIVDGDELHGLVVPQ